MDLYKKFQRITTSGKFLPEIDGLRFIAVFSVVMYHLAGTIDGKNPHIYIDNADQYEWIRRYLGHGHYGVQLFFAISGFILALPFVKHYLTGAQKPVLKQYFLRRVTRLEPPYFLVMIGLFIFIVYVQHKYPFGMLFRSLLASLTYTHNFFYGRDVIPYVNGVAWTLEIEVQFYIIAPLIAAWIFSIKSVKSRRMLIWGVALFFILLQHFYKPPFTSLYDQIQFFLIGFLLADYYITPGQSKIALPKVVSIFAGLILLFGIFYYQPAMNTPGPVKLLWNVLFPVMIFALYYLTLFTDFWKRFFSNKILTTVGGMCYSIYLLHSPIMAMVANYTVKLHQFSNYYAIDWLIQTAILLTVMLVCSSVFFLLVEKPCMDRDWYKKFSFRIKKRFKAKEMQLGGTTIE